MAVTLRQHYPVITDLATSLVDQGPSGIDLANANVTIADDTDIVATETHKVWVFNGTTAQLNATAPQNPRNAFSCCLWLKRAATGVNHGLISWAQAGTNDRIECEMNTSNEVISLVRSATAGIISNADKGATSFGTNWAHVAWAYDPDNGVAIWVNGTQIVTPSDDWTAAMPGSPTTFDRFCIGARAFSLAGAFHSGRVKDVRVFDGLFSTGEVAAIVADTTFGMGGGSPPLVAASMDGGMTPMDGGF